MKLPSCDCLCSWASINFMHSSIALSENPNAIELLKNNPTKIVWRNLSANPAPYAVKLLKENKTKIDWDYLSVNTNPYAIELLKANRNKINWPFLSENEAAIELLKDNERQKEAN